MTEAELEKKLQAAKRRKATAEASEVMQSMANISDLGDVTEEDIRNQILEEVTNGKDANQAVKTFFKHVIDKKFWTCLVGISVKSRRRKKWL